MPYSTAFAPCGLWASFLDESPKQIRHLKSVYRQLLLSIGTDLPYQIFVPDFIGCFSLYYFGDFLISKIDTAPAIFIVLRTQKYPRKRHDTKTFPKGIVFFWEIVHQMLFYTNLGIFQICASFSQNRGQRQRFFLNIASFLFDISIFVYNFEVFK